MFAMQPAQALGASGFFEGRARVVDPAAGIFPVGTPLTWDTTNHILKEHPLSTTTTNVLGVSLDPLSATGVTANLDGLVNYAAANRLNVFAAVLTNGSDTVVVPTVAHVGQQYGVTKHSTLGNAWFSVDINNTHLTVEVVSYDNHMNIVFFKWLEAAIQEV